MPKVPIDYANTIIYKLVHKDDLYDENIYTGHTTDMRNRKYQHKESCINPNSKKYNRKNYKYIRENGGWDEWLMIEIEKYPCKDVHEAVARERVVQTEMKAKLNTEVPARTLKEYYQDNKELLAERKKQYRKNNFEKLREYERNRRPNKNERNEQKKEKTTCEHCGSIVSKYTISSHKKSQKCINFKPA